MNENSLAPGTVLHGQLTNYVIESTIGKGGFGITYRASAIMPVNGMNVTCTFAIKEHFPTDWCERAADNTLRCSAPVMDKVKASLKDFFSEAKRLKNIGMNTSCPNIVRISEVFHANGTAYMVMEYLSGQTLAQIIDDRGALSVDETLRYMLPIIDACSILHSFSVTHLDIKPSNIMLTRDIMGNERPVLIDFGIAKHYDQDGLPTSTINQVCCTPGYAPIEQYTGLHRFSPPSDVYALGATLLHLLSGNKPIPADEITPQSISSSLANIDVNITNAIIQAMRYARSERIQSASTLASMLRQSSDATITIQPPSQHPHFSNSVSENNSTNVKHQFETKSNKISIYTQNKKDNAVDKNITNTYAHLTGFVSKLPRICLIIQIVALAISFFGALVNTATPALLGLSFTAWATFARYKNFDKMSKQLLGIIIAVLFLIVAFISDLRSWAVLIGIHIWFFPLYATITIASWLAAWYQIARLVHINPLNYLWGSAGVLLFVVGVGRRLIYYCSPGWNDILNNSSFSFIVLLVLITSGALTLMSKILPKIRSKIYCIVLITITVLASLNAITTPFLGFTILPITEAWTFFLNYL